MTPRQYRWYLAAFTLAVALTVAAIRAGLAGGWVALAAITAWATLALVAAAALGGAVTEADYQERRHVRYRREFERIIEAQHEYDQHHPTTDQENPS